ncbi:MAG: 16S rRNA (guanine(966)-N(2))-methyltransferase RsmD [Parachlamydia sp.]|jgi:16S rRNA (guanine966-N2)-methyltransferase|nr:16S rRNA (guanine(966)-N(2))-methyltransferase RsmD [Parachlamydia sp.]
MHIISGLYRRHPLAAPKTQLTRPTASRLREALFNICQNYIEAVDFLDIFAGSGAMGFEALSRGAASATFIDSSKEAIRCIEKNAAALNVKSASHIIYGEVISQLGRLAARQKGYGIIFADPPYLTMGDSSLYLSEEILVLFDKSPLLLPSGDLFLEEDHRFQPREGLLQNLQLIDQRRMGPAVLQHYQLN